jgi:AraC-like DNA-binding protein
MSEELLACVSRYADAHHEQGVVCMPFAGLAAYRQVRPSPMQFAVLKPLVALVLQGSKRVAVGNEVFNFSAGQSLLITTDVPSVSQITRASLAQPYYSFTVELDIPLIEGLVREMSAQPVRSKPLERVVTTHTEVVQTLTRMMNLLERPEAIPLLGAQLMRELHYWLLAGQHGPAIRALGTVDSHAQRISRTVAKIRRDFATPLRVEELADVAGMSLSSFHQHFRSITSLTPLQYQKHLRLIEARRILIEGSAISRAASEVGYESVPQFTREYSRFFGQPPARDIRQLKTRLAEV